ncbi:MULTISPECIES: hypothetical protein [unclassified Streptomyces]|uniref:hypothetical protein n=1 Tax=unclassified Streptomyces TaxID=2593676 RepID=UPI002E2A95A2|nr:hypothetical protein [Streptomyces sp. NBC_00223]
MSSPSRPARTAALLLLAVALTACGASGPRTGALDQGSPDAHPTCRVHQHVLPGSDYTGGKDSSPRAVLDMLRYYTSQRALPFCDHKPPTAQDSAWTGLYDRLTRR